jgi:hypothetical protein
VTADDETYDDDGAALEASDVEVLNTNAVSRTAALARSAGTTLVAIGGVGLLSWLWLVYRSQDQAGRYDLSPVPGSGLGAEDPTLADRLELLANYTTTLVFAVAVAGLGVLLRLAADYAVARTGGSVTGYRAGDTP